MAIESYSSMGKINWKERAKDLKRDVPAVYLTMKDVRTPILPKVIAVLTVVYALSPIDLIPDFIPVLGYLDDLIILPAMVTLMIKLIPKDVWQEKQEEATELWADGKPKNWLFAIPIVLIWVFIIYLIFFK